MKLSHSAAVSILALAAVASVGAIGLVTAQFGAQGSAAQVVIDTAITGELSGVFDAVKDLPDTTRREVLARHGVDSLNALAESLDGQRAQLGRAEQERAAALARNDKQLSALLVLTLFNVFALAMGAVCLFDAYHRKEKANRHDALRTTEAAKA